MAVAFDTTLRSARADAIDTAIGAGGKLKIYTSAYGTLLATWTWTGQAFGAASSGVITMAAPDAVSVNAAATGTAALAKLTTSADADIVTGLTVGTSATNVIVDSVSITSGDPLVLDYAASTITEGNA